MEKTLRPYQQEALNQLRVRLKETTDPLLVNASVGAGKSLIIAELLKIIEKANWRALCLTMNSTLIQQNAETYQEQGGHPGIYCSGLGQKDITAPVIFGSPHSIAKGIKANKKIKEVPFNLIVIDEAHNINPDDNASMYMRILNHYGLQAQTEQYNFRIVGLTGTPYRGKSVSIVGKEALFKEQVCSISTSWLIANDFLVPPIFGKPRVESFDMKDIRTDSLGKFRNKDLEEAIHRNERLTGQIIREVVSVVEGGRNGAFIFASTIPHAEECMRSLPSEHSAIITGDTPHEKRKKILAAAKQGHIKYLVNVATLLVGVDVPNFDVCAWLRPTESLTLYVQGIGRVLRLSQGKKDALVLDYAGNLERHGDLDDPIIVDALKQQDKEKEYCIPCFDCGTMNTLHARRCIGYRDKEGNVLPRGEGVKAVTKKGYNRCEHFFEFKTCDACETMNDKVARQCRGCGCELIDPNAKLSEIGESHTFDIIDAQYWTKKNYASGTPSIFVRYRTKQGDVFESYYVSSEKAKYVFYGKFVKHHVQNSSLYFPYLDDPEKVDEMIYETELKTPNQIICNIDSNKRFKVMRKIFFNSDI